MQLSWYRY